MKNLFKTFLKEDAPQGDITTAAIFGKKIQNATGVLLAKEDLVLSGLTTIKYFLRELFPRVTLDSQAQDGHLIGKGQKFATLTGSIQDLLLAERVCLNLLQHLSGIATLTHEFIKISQNQVIILDTRKTTPGLRDLEKQAVCHGGGKNHRLNLSDHYLIKENHIAAAGSVTKALEKVSAHNQRYYQGKKHIIVEVTDLEELKEALAKSPDVILLDNMTPQQIKQAVKIRNKISKKNAPQLEVSGGVSLINLKNFISLGVERISIGALTHSARAADISFLIV